MKNHFFKNYLFSLILLASVVFGACLGIVFGEKTAWVKPLGDLFLNLLFTAVVPLVFFSIASSIAEMSDLRRLGKVLGWMTAIFVGTGILSSGLMLLGVRFFPPILEGPPVLTVPEHFQKGGTVSEIFRLFAVPDFAQLLSKQNMPALILFAMLTGFATSLAKESGKPFAKFLVSGSKVMMQLIRLILFYAPVGLCAYFAYLVGTLGAGLLSPYLRVIAVYYPLVLLYFFLGTSLYAWFAGGTPGSRAFWSHILPPALTAWGTGSSVATVPVNLEAADRIGVPSDVSRIVVPVGATVHMDGSCMAAIVKIALLFAFLGIPFEGAGTYLIAIGTALLAGMVMSGVPGGGFLGELLIVTLYGFPPEALPLLAMVGTLVDPPATMVNATGDTAASMLVSRILNGKGWMKEEKNGSPPASAF